jgi:hypothetical protein
MASLQSQPIPTLQLQKPEEISFKLLRLNNGCSLPCWWGITPGQTFWSDAEEFLESFSDISLSESVNWSVYFVRSPISKDYSSLEEIRAIYATQDGLVKEIQVSEFDERTYHISNFIKKYGIPSRVLVSSYSSDYGLPPNQVPLSLNLYYPEKGINALYGTYATIKGEDIEGCLDKSPNLFLWSPEHTNRSVEYILGWDNTSTPYMDIEEATGLSIKDFFDVYSDSQNNPCIYTKKNLWPSQ